MLEKYLLIDNYLNETRVAIAKDGVLEDFDDELPTSKLKKGNIYIGRIMRIEPSLQAAFVDFGFEKHGFLAFSEIRPPEAQRPAVSKSAEVDPVLPNTEAPAPEPALDLVENEEDERPQRPTMPSGKIHDMIKRQQLVMVQVIKDERGTKGAALTTYISLPGRYGFLLPNTPKASGVSKKITDSTEREALKGILGSLELPEGMSFILRSASMGRKKSEIKRDYEFLMKTWHTVSAHPVESVGLVYSEQDLLIRALRDLYANDVKEVIIQGEDAFKRAKSYIRAVFPSHSKKISLHSDTVGLFEKFKIESHIQSIYDHTVKLPSGGSIVLNQTEALVSIDVNSSKSTQERNIEDTALKTNLEATVAIARNLKLRDLAGLIVIDFIDLHPSKRPLVEKALKDALSTDRARLKIGKISEFGLLEMSRQRLRQSLMETNTHVCTTCHGSGRLLSLAMQSMQALRSIERMASLLGPNEPIIARGSSDIIVCLLNDHRQFLCDIEKKYTTSIQISCDMQHASGFFEIISPVTAPVVAEKPALIEGKSASPKKRRRNRGKALALAGSGVDQESSVDSGSTVMETRNQPINQPMPKPINQPMPNDHLASQFLPRAAKPAHQKEPSESGSIVLLPSFLGTKSALFEKNNTHHHKNKHQKNHVRNSGTHSGASGNHGNNGSIVPLPLPENHTPALAPLPSPTLVPALQSSLDGGNRGNGPSLSRRSRLRKKRQARNRAEAAMENTTLSTLQAEVQILEVGISQPQEEGSGPIVSKKLQPKNPPKKKTQTPNKMQGNAQIADRVEEIYVQNPSAVPTEQNTGHLVKDTEKKKAGSKNSQAKVQKKTGKNIHTNHTQTKDSPVIEAKQEGLQEAQKVSQTEGKLGKKGTNRSQRATNTTQENLQTKQPLVTDLVSADSGGIDLMFGSLSVNSMNSGTILLPNLTKKTEAKKQSKKQATDPIQDPSKNQNDKEKKAIGSVKKAQPNAQSNAQPNAQPNQKNQADGPNPTQKQRGKPPRDVEEKPAMVQHRKEKKAKKTQESSEAGSSGSMILLPPIGSR